MKSRYPVLLFSKKYLYYLQLLNLILQIGSSYLSIINEWLKAMASEGNQDQAGYRECRLLFKSIIYYSIITKISIYFVEIVITEYTLVSFE